LDQHWREAEVKGPSATIDAQRFTEADSTINVALGVHPELHCLVSSFYSRGTLDIYKKSLHSFLNAVGDQELSSITAWHIDRFRQHRLGEVSPTTLNVDLRTLRSAFSFAVRWKMLDVNPFTKVPLCQIPDSSPLFFKPADFNRLASGINESWLKSIVILAACTGLRRGELVNLTWNDVDWMQKVVRIHSSMTFKTKSGKRRTVPLNEPAMKLLRELHDRRSTDYVFTINGRKVRDVWVTRRFKHYLRKQGFGEEYHFHHIRHSTASWLIQMGTPIYEIQKLLGHSTIKITEIYAALAPSQLHGTVEMLTKQLTFN
jgi:integrase